MASTKPTTDQMLHKMDYPFDVNLHQLLSGELRNIKTYDGRNMSDADMLRAALADGSVRIPYGYTLDISDNSIINVPANRLILVEYGANINSNGRFTSYGVNNVHYVVNGIIRCTGQVAAPALSGWPNTAAGTQNGDERGFIEFGGVVFAGNDGSDYSVSGTGSIIGYWSGTPNVIDLPTQLNRKGIAAWNCSNFSVVGVHISGFEGEQVYWYSRNINGKNILFDGVTSEMARFNALNINSYNALINIKVRDCTTNVSYNGIETSAGDVVNTTHYAAVNTGILFGHGTGGGNRLIQGNKIVDCDGTSYSLIYNKDYEGQGYVPNITVIGNTAIRSGSHDYAISGITGLIMIGNSSYERRGGRFIQITTCQGGYIGDNVSYKPAVGTSHYYEADCYSVLKGNNPMVTLGGSYVALQVSDHGIIGGLNATSTAAGARENFIDLRGDNPAAGAGAEVRFSLDVGPAFTPATLSVGMVSYDVTGAKADFQFNNLKVTGGDTLGTSWFIRSSGHLEPGLDNYMNVGSPTNRANTIYAGTGAINTSDRRCKMLETEVSDVEYKVATKLKKLLRKYKFRDAIELKNDNARWHFGIVAQDVRDAFTSEGLDASEYGLFCFDEWDDEYATVYRKVLTGNVVIGDDGTEIPEVVYEDTGERELVKVAGSRFGIRYDELLCFIVSAL